MDTVTPTDNTTITWASQHPCRSNNGQLTECVRCGTQAGNLYTSSCQPGLFVHVGPQYTGGYWTESCGYITIPPEDGHPMSAPCPRCFDQAADAAARTIPTTTDTIVSGVLAQPGDVIYCSSQPARVLAVVDYGAGEHHCPIIPQRMCVRQVITSIGWRWFGHEPGDVYHTTSISADQCITFTPGRVLTYRDVPA